jgi:hypothetical protein
MHTDFIRQHKKKTITLDEIEKHLIFSSQKELYNLIQEYINHDILVPCGKGMTYKTPSIPTKFKIIPEDHSEILEEINKLKLIDTKYYRKNPLEFEHHKKWLCAINKYFAKSIPEEIPLSLNERSLSIFKDEKFLSSKTGKTVITNLNLSLDDFNVYYAPEIFMYYRHTTQSGNVLIIENKDTWVTFKKNLISNKNILNFEFDAIIFGEGKKIINSFSFIKDDEFNAFNSKENTFYYFGDVDSSGISILYSLIHKYNDYKIKPFMPCYEILFNNITQYGHIKYHEDLTEKKDNCISAEQIAFCFPKTDINVLYDFCKQSKIIPQEVVNNEVLNRGGVVSC